MFANRSPVNKVDSFKRRNLLSSGRSLPYLSSVVEGLIPPPPTPSSSFAPRVIWKHLSVDDDHLFSVYECLKMIIGLVIYLYFLMQS